MQLVMRKYKFLIISTVVLFLMINTDYYWNGLFFGFDLVLKLFYLISFFVLTICLLRQLFLIIQERLQNRPRIYLILIMGLLLGLIAIKPFGIIDFEKFEGKDLFIGWQEGTANCSTTLKLKENEKFTIMSYCFGEDKIRGTYSLKGDTIKLKFSSLGSMIKRYEYGIYKPYADPQKKIVGEILMYTSKKDTMPYPLTVFKNELIK